MKSMSGSARVSVSLQLALLALIGSALLAGIVPAWLALDRWLARELEARVWREVAVAPAILADRTQAIGSAMMMHAKDLAHMPELIDALVLGDRGRALRVADDVARAQGQLAVVVAGDGAVWRGPPPTPALIEATRRGEMPVVVVVDSLSLFLVSLAPVEHAGKWIGAAGVASPLDQAAAGALAGLTRSDLVLLLGATGSPVPSNDLPTAPAIARAILGQPQIGGPRELRVDEVRYLAATAPLAGATVAFVRDLRRELAILPRLRLVLVASGAAALIVAVLLGSLLAMFLMRPVRELAIAADRVSRGDFDTPLAASPVREVQRVTRAFNGMRTTLAVRIEQLRAANRLLEERQAKLAAMQSELIRRERTAVSGRMAVELAHEIRNPVANLRNCLELLHRRLEDDAQGREYAALAIDELLRMHELAERMLDLNRPRHPDVGECDAAEVAREVAALTRLGGDATIAAVNVRALGTPVAAIPPDALKQVLLNLVQNAREAMPRGLVVDIAIGSADESTWITVADNGPGVPPEIRSSIFDPFVTARAPAGGTGLGLFMVEGVVAAHGGTVQLVDEGNHSGACFRITIPAAQSRAAAAKAAETAQLRP